MDRSALWAPFEDKSTQLGTGSGAVSTLCVTQRPLRLRGFAICIKFAAEDAETNR